MEKTNFSKRVIAGTLALVTVFGTAPASLQGVFAPSALIADAAATDLYNLKLNEAAKVFVTSVTTGSVEYNAEGLKRAGYSVKIAKGDVVSIKSPVPLKFDVENPADNAADVVSYTNDAGNTLTVAQYNTRKAKYDAALADSKKYTQTPAYKFNTEAAPTGAGFTYADSTLTFTTPIYKALGEGNYERATLSSGEDGEVADEKAIKTYQSEENPTIYYKVKTAFSISDGEAMIGYVAGDYFTGNLETVVAGEGNHTVREYVEKTGDNPDQYRKWTTNLQPVTFNEAYFTQAGAWETEGENAATYISADAYLGLTSDTAKSLFQAEPIYVRKPEVESDTLPAVITASDYATNYTYVMANNAYDGYEPDYEFNVGDGKKVTRTGSKGNYTYTFTAPSNTDAGNTEITIGVEMQDSALLFDNKDDNTVPNGLTITDGVTTYNGGFVGSDNATEEYDFTNASLVKESKVTVTAEEPFKVTINDRNASSNLTIPTVTFDPSLDNGNGLFVAKFDMPASSDADRPVNVRVQKITEQFTFTTSGNKLIANSNSVKNVEAATVTPFFYRSVDKATYDATVATAAQTGAAAPANATTGIIKYTTGTGADQKWFVKTPITSDVATGTKIYFDVTVANNLCEYSKFELFKGTTAVDGKTNTVDIAGAKGITLNDNGTLTGTYTAKLTVKEKADATKTHEMSINFNISTPEKLTAENVRLNITLQKDDHTADKIAANNLLAKTGETTIFSLKNGVKLVSGFTVTPTVYKDAKKTGDGADKLTPNAQYTVTGYTSGSTVNNEYKLTINVHDNFYGTYSFDVTWKVASYQSAYYWKANPDAVELALEDLDKLGDEVYAKATAEKPENDKLVDKKDVTYAYVNGLNGAAIDEDELDTRENGLPTKEGQYTVYVLVDGEAKTKVNVTIGNLTAVTIEYDESKLALTYGDELDVKAFKIKETKSGKYIEDNTVNIVKYGTYVDEWHPGLLFYKVALDNNGKPILNTAADYAKTGRKYKAVEDFRDYNTGDLFDGKYLNAGTYAVKMSAVEVPAQGEKKKYSITQPEDLIVTVSKKAITTEMISFLPVDVDKAANGYDIAANAANNPAVFFDKDTGKAGRGNIVTITEGSKEKNVGKYTCTVKANDNTNYTGTAKANWYIVDEENDDIQSGIDWVNEKTTIYDNGRMHFEVKRNADDKLILDGEKVPVKEFGIIIDKTGKFEKMAGRGGVEDAKAIAEEFLVYGNGYATGSYTVGDKRGDAYDAAKQQQFKVNIKAQDVTTNIYARPFIVVTDKNGNDVVTYGKVRAYNLTDVATQEFNLVCADGGKTYSPYNKVKREKDLDRKADNYQEQLATVRNGYDARVNKFYAYASFTDLDKLQNGKEFKVSNFGVIIDKTGKLDDRISKKFGADVNANGGDYWDYVKSQLVFDGDYQVGKYDPNNKVLKSNQFAANITPQDSVTGLWVRAYLDLGDGLIIYTEPTYYASASEYFASVNGLNAKPTASIQKVDPATPSDHKLKATINVIDHVVQIPGAQNVSVKRKGVVLEKDGIYNDGNVNKLIIGSSDGVKTGSLSGNTAAYVGKFTPNVGKAAYLRPFVEYTIDGKDVTIYGDPYKIEVDKDNVIKVNNDPIYFD